MKMRICSALLLTLLLGLGGCAAKQDSLPENSLSGSRTSASADEPDFDDYGYDDEIEVSDPLRGWNKVWFSFNDVMFRYVMDPVYKGYSYVVPEKVRSGISHFGDNLMAPVRFLNHLLQGEFAQAGVEIGRFIINSTTSLGFADVASQSKPLYPYYPEFATFSHTLGSWGIAEGPYFILPFFGPSTLRGAVGSAGDIALDPRSYTLDWEVSLPLGAELQLNDMGTQLDAYKQVTDSALEPYSALRNAWMSRAASDNEKREARKTGFSMRLETQAE